MKVLILTFVLALTCSAAQIKDHPRVEFELRFAEETPADGLVEAKFEDHKIYLHEKSVITNSDIVDAQAIEAIREGVFSIEISLSPEGVEKISKATEANVGKTMALLINGEIKSAPKLMSALSSSSFIIEGNFNRETAEKLADGIKSK